MNELHMLIRDDSVYLQYIIIVNHLSVQSTIKSGKISSLDEQDNMALCTNAVPRAELRAHHRCRRKTPLIV